MDTLSHRVDQAYGYAFFGALLLLAIAEWIVPRRASGEEAARRWIGNVGVAIVDALVLRLFFPLTGLVWASYCAAHGWGLFNRVAWVPSSAALALISVVTLDATTYALHRAFHRVPVLWRLHVVHHTDHDVDVTTAFRFHPLEAILTTAVRLALIAGLGLPALGVACFELLSAMANFWEHANVRIPPAIDRVLRLVVVTPEWHRTHHARDGRDSRANLGNLLTCWDRLFRTYREHPHVEPVAIGVAGFEDSKHLTLPWMLVQPVLTEPAPVAAPTRSR